MFKAFFPNNGDNSEEVAHAIATIFSGLGAVDRSKVGPDDADVLDKALEATTTSLAPIMGRSMVQMVEAATGETLEEYTKAEIIETFCETRNPDAAFRTLDSHRAAALSGFLRAHAMLGVPSVMHLMLGDSEDFMELISDSETAEKLMRHAEAVGRVVQRCK